MSSDNLGSGDSQSWIKAVSVAVPVAFCIVLLTIFGTFALIMIGYLRARFRRGGMVNFTTGDLLRRNADINDDIATL